MPIDKPPNVFLAAGCLPPLDSYDADIIIITLGRFEDTLNAVQSALSQTSISFHVTLLDQGSHAEMRAALIREYSNRTNLALFFSDRNTGVAGGRNIVTAAGHGHIIVALDNDAVFANDYAVATAIDVFATHPTTAAIGFKILSATGADLDHASWGYSNLLKLRQNDTFLTTTFVGAGHAIRRAAWDQAGGYDPSLFFTWEEYDFCLRAIALGWRIEYCGSIAIHHKITPEARISWRGDRARHYVRNRLIIARKWHASWIGLTPLILGYLLRGVINRRIRTTISGLIHAVSADRAISKVTMPESMKAYIAAHERRRRGRLATRIFAELKRRPSIH